VSDPLSAPAMPAGPEHVPLQRLVAFYESLSRDSLASIATIYSADAHFRDPFNDVRGIGAIEAIFADMFERTRTPRFVVTATVRQGDAAFVTWDFHFGLGQRELRVQGCSQLHFDAQGQVDVHRDYWDAAGELYEQLPLLGVLMRALRRRLSAQPHAR
jgi:ketosteroid isomerase-like protein